jgi:hypothetical protein
MQSRSREIVLRRYIVQKHESLYGQHYRKKREFLAKGYEHEAEVNQGLGRRWFSMCLFWQAFWLSPSGARLEKALKATIGEFLGGNVIRKIRTIRGRFAECRSKA